MEYVSVLRFINEKAARGSNMLDDQATKQQSYSEIYKLKKENASEATKVLTDAFYDDPLLRYVCEFEGNRLGKTSYIIKSVLSLGIHYGEVWALGNPVIAGAAIWMPPDFKGISLFRSLRTGIFFEKYVLGKSAAKRYSVFNATTDDLHHKIAKMPHWYLFVIGIKPSLQGKGLGTKLIKHMLARTDEEKVPVFLTAPNPTNIGYYEKLGFNVMGKAKVPGSDLVVPGLLRLPSEEF